VVLANFPGREDTARRGEVLPIFFPTGKYLIYYFIFNFCPENPN